MQMVWEGYLEMFKGAIEGIVRFDLNSHFRNWRYMASLEPFTRSSKLTINN